MSVEKNNKAVEETVVKEVEAEQKPEKKPAGKKSAGKKPASSTVAKDTTTSNDVEEKKPTRKSREVVFKPNDIISCRSVCYGELILKGQKSNITYTWTDCGDVADIEFQDLQALQLSKSRFLTDPLFVIEDEELIEYWGNMLKPIYDKIAEEDIEELLYLSPDELRYKLNTLPNGIKESVKSMAASKFINGELDSLNCIKVLDEVLGTELTSLL